MRKTIRSNSDRIETNVENLQPSIIGTYEGECADSNITNLNGLDITREVWENVFNSDEYKKAIEHGWYIGYLGHPEGDPDCQDFRKACIVMTEGHIDNDGKVYGKFNLIDTPVGRIVKAFQDAGVKFGISVRGAGDIVQNSVDPDTFVFRGFDLVTFPAFPESIPEFTAIAASTDSTKQSQYRAVCAAVKSNIDALDTVQSINIVQSCFAPQSEEYKVLESKKQSIQSDECIECVDPRVDAMTCLYLELKDENENLRQENIELQQQMKALLLNNSRKVSSIERIFTSQFADINSELDKVESSLKFKTVEVKNLNKKLNMKEDKLLSVQASMRSKTRKISELNSEIDRLESSLSNIKSSLTASSNMNRILTKQLNESKSNNLKYNEKVEVANSTIRAKDEIISRIQTELDETVRKQVEATQDVSNLDSQLNSLKSKVKAAKQLTAEYQYAYANLYANAIGINLPDLDITENTNVTSLQHMIRASSSVNRSNILEPTQDVDPSYFDDISDDSDDLVTL